MSDAGPENWIYLIGSGIGSAILVAYVALRQFFTGVKTEDTAGAITANAIGAAFVDRTAAEAVLRIDTNLAKLVRLTEDRLEREHEEDLAERLADRLRRELTDKLAKP